MCYIQHASIFFFFFFGMVGMELLYAEPVKRYYIFNVNLI